MCWLGKAFLCTRSFYGESSSQFPGVHRKALWGVNSLAYTSDPCSASAHVVASLWRNLSLLAHMTVVIMTSLGSRWSPRSQEWWAACLGSTHADNLHVFSQADRHSTSGLQLVFANSGLRGNLSRSDHGGIAAGMWGGFWKWPAKVSVKHSWCARCHCTAHLSWWRG